MKQGRWFNKSYAQHYFSERFGVTATESRMFRSRDGSYDGHIAEHAPHAEMPSHDDPRSLPSSPRWGALQLQTIQLAHPADDPTNREHAVTPSSTSVHHSGGIKEEATGWALLRAQLYAYKPRVMSRWAMACAHKTWWRRQADKCGIALSSRPYSSSGEPPTAHMGSTVSLLQTLKWGETALLPIKESEELRRQKRVSVLLYIRFGPWFCGMFRLNVRAERYSMNMQPFWHTGKWRVVRK